MIRKTSWNFAGWSLKKFGILKLVQILDFWKEKVSLGRNVLLPIPVKKRGCQCWKPLILYVGSKVRSTWYHHPCIQTDIWRKVHAYLNYILFSSKIIMRHVSNINTYAFISFTQRNVFKDVAIVTAHIFTSKLR